MAVSTKAIPGRVVLSKATKPTETPKKITNTGVIKLQAATLVAPILATFLVPLPYVRDRQRSAFLVDRKS